MSPRTATTPWDAGERALMERYCEQYKIFLDGARTERESVRSAIELAKLHGFEELTPETSLVPAAASTTPTAARACCWP